MGAVIGFAYSQPDGFWEIDKVWLEETDSLIID
jgi:hypothetical protein